MKLPNDKLKKLKNAVVKIGAAAFWIVLWQIIALIVNNDIILPSPISVIVSLGQLFITGNFWLSIWNSFYNIVCGFLIALTLGVIAAVLSNRYRVIRELLSPLMSFLKTAPVVALILLLLIVLRGTLRLHLGMVVSVIMVLPIIYLSTLGGLSQVDAKLLETAKVFRVPALKKYVYIYASGALPQFISGAKVALGLCWKAGVAAEVIGLITDTIGENMTGARSLLNMSEVFAWMLVIMLVSFAFEKLFLLLIKSVKTRIER